MTTRDMIVGCNAIQYNALLSKMSAIQPRDPMVITVMKKLWWRCWWGDDDERVRLFTPTLCREALAMPSS